MNPVAGRSARLLASLIALVAVPAGAAELRPFFATYEVTYFGISAGTSDLHLHQLPDGLWLYESRLDANLRVRLLVPRSKIPPDERSRFRIQDGRIVPESFSAGDGSADDPKAQQLTFDWQRGRVTGTAERKPVDLPLQPGLLDPMSVQLALMLDLANARRPAHFSVLDKDRIKEYDYAAEGTATVKTRSGEFHTVIYRSRRVGSDKSTLFWCAPELAYLPVKVEGHEGDEKKWSLALKAVQMDPPG